MKKENSLLSGRWQKVKLPRMYKWIHLCFSSISNPSRTKDLTSDEKLVLDHITGARNEGVSESRHWSALTNTTRPLPGIWTKTLKAKTNLHQNVVDRCLKSLAQKKLIKRVPSVNVCVDPAKSWLLTDSTCDTEQEDLHAWGFGALRGINRWSVVYWWRIRYWAHPPSERGLP